MRGNKFLMPEELHRNLLPSMRKRLLLQNKTSSLFFRNLSLYLNNCFFPFYKKITVAFFCTSENKFKCVYSYLLIIKLLIVNQGSLFKDVKNRRQIMISGRYYELR